MKRNNKYRKEAGVLPVKKAISILLCMVLVMGLAGTAFAADPALEREPVVFYQTENALCTFFSVNSTNPTPMKVKTSMFGDAAYPTSRMSDGDTPMTYIILLDATWTMVNHKKEASQFVASLFNGSYDHTYMVLVPYNYYGIMEKDVVISLGAAETQDKINRLNYMGYDTNPAPQVRGMLELLNTEYPVETGGLVNLVLISDKVDRIPSQEEDYRAIQNLLNGMPQILFHTIQLGAAKGALPDFGRGFHIQTDSTISAETAGGMINSFVSGLERVTLPLQENRDGEVQLYLQPTEKNQNGSNAFPSMITLPWVPYVDAFDTDLETISDIPDTIFHYKASAGTNTGTGEITFYSSNAGIVDMMATPNIVFPGQKDSDPISTENGAESSEPSAPIAAPTLPDISFIPSTPEPTPTETAGEEPAEGAESAEMAGAGEATEPAEAPEIQSVEEAAETEEPARPDPQFELASAYRTRDKAVLFLDITGVGEGYVPQNYQINGSDVKLEKVSDIQETEKVTHVILIDLSASMQDYAADVKSFLVALAQNSQLDTRFVLAGYRDSVLMDSLVDTRSAFSQSEVLDQISNACNAFSYFDENGQTGKSILEMIDYIQQAFPARPGSLVNLILLTNQAENLNTELVQQALDTCPELVFSSVVFGRESVLPFRSSGVQTFVNSDQAPYAAAEQLTQRLGSFYRVQFPITINSDERSSFSFRIGTNPAFEGAFLKEAGAHDVALFVTGENGVHIGGELASVREMEAVQNLLMQEEISALLDEEPEDDAEATEANEAEEEARSEQEITEQTETEEKTERHSPIKWIAILVLLVLILLIVLLLALRGRRVKRDGPQIPMMLTVIHGDCKKDGKVIVLTDQVIIGRDRGCDVVFNNPDVSRRNTKVFLKNGFVFIEDLNSANGTALDGMRIYSQNRLRSGDEISIGSVKFCFKF